MKTISAIITIVSLSLIIAIGWSYDQPKKPENLIPPPPLVSTNDIVINPQETHCIAQPYGTKQDGWRRLRTQDESYVHALVKRGIAEFEYPRPQTMRCRDVTKNPIAEFYLRETWWRMKRKDNWSACGDYTRPDVPYPVVVGV